MPEIEVIRVIKILIIFKTTKDLHQPIGCQHLGLQWVEEEEEVNHYWFKRLSTPLGNTGHYSKIWKNNKPL
jgi:hypothetical protein